MHTFFLQMKIYFNFETRLWVYQTTIPYNIEQTRFCDTVVKKLMGKALQKSRYRKGFYRQKCPRPPPPAHCVGLDQGKNDAVSGPKGSNDTLTLAP